MNLRILELNSYNKKTFLSNPNFSKTKEFEICEFRDRLRKAASKPRVSLLGTKEIIAGNSVQSKLEAQSKLYKEKSRKTNESMIREVVSSPGKSFFGKKISSKKKSPSMNSSTFFRTPVGEKNISHFI